ncbi:hypothetical protein [Acinetobacter rathckeae]|uniref:hypothetical protein n=1 Tax=Acinetobacter rathckeae TaxID=2605272 RepID=UPI0018A33AF2|nr:hypothetical protein [Acinetobacter rathckeae]MBF7688695.1 hypothetical protein [Acinetobacter rathckeae]MBF7696088.1 hypothetical protein [Acinetobacter rathckeae]
MSFVRPVILTLSCFGMCVNIAQATNTAGQAEVDHGLQSRVLFIHQDLLNRPQLKISEHALEKQKENLNSQVSDHDDLVMLNTIHAAPTQNFFAAQQQRFSRFLQNLLALCNS